MAHKKGAWVVHRNTGMAGRVVSTHSSTTQIATKAGNMIDHHSAFRPGKGRLTGFAYFLITLVTVGMIGLALGVIS